MRRGVHMNHRDPAGLAGLPAWIRIRLLRVVLPGFAHWDVCKKTVSDTFRIVSGGKRSDTPGSVHSEALSKTSGEVTGANQSVIPGSVHLEAPSETSEDVSCATQGETPRSVHSEMPSETSRNVARAKRIGALWGRRPASMRKTSPKAQLKTPGNIGRGTVAAKTGRRRGRPVPGQQAGVFLLELGLALMLALIGAIWAGAQVMQAVRDGQAEATGNYLLAIKGAMDGAIAGNFHAYARGLPLTSADGATRFANPMAPTLAELRTLGHLPSSFPDLTPAGQSVLIKVQRDAARCPGIGCRVEALIHTTTAFRGRTEDVDYQAAALAVSTMEGWGGAAWFDQPDKIRGTAFTQDNPVSASAGGIVGVMAMLDTSMWNQFVRMGDDRDPALQGNLSVNGSVSAKRVGLRETVVPNSACTATDFANPATPNIARIDLADNIEYARTASGGLVGCIGNVWRSVAVVATVGGVCGNAAYPEGTIGTDISGAGLLCRDAAWSPISQWLSRYTIMTTHLAPQTLTGSATSTSVPKPLCGLSGGVAGTPSVYVIPQSLQNRGSFALSGSRNGDNISVSGTMTLDPLNFQASNAGTTWSVAAPANSQAVVVTYCAYS